MAAQRIISIDITHLVTAALAGERSPATEAEPALVKPTTAENPRRYAAWSEAPPE